jgi:hypothetical protein
VLQPQPTGRSGPDDCETTGRLCSACARSGTPAASRQSGPRWLTNTSPQGRPLPPGRQRAVPILSSTLRCLWRSHSRRPARAVRCQSGMGAKCWHQVGLPAPRRDIGPRPAAPLTAATPPPAAPHGPLTTRQRHGACRLLSMHAVPIQRGTPGQRSS